MSSFKDISKASWKPKVNEGKLKERLRKDFKGIDQVAGWIGKGKESSLPNDRAIHPISSLKDPSTFEPPPKRADYCSQLTIDKERPADIARSRPCPTPYTANISATLPSYNSRSSLRDEKSILKDQELPVDRTIKPCPPRLPPRANSNPALPATGNKGPDHSENLFKKYSSNIREISGTTFRAPASKFERTLKQSHILPPPSSNNTTMSTSIISGSAKNQSDSSHITSLLSPKSQSTAEGTSFEQKRATLKTANSLWKDPSSVSLNDARMAANTANNFRERHGSQIKSGLQLVQNVDKKYALSDKISSSQHFSNERGQVINTSEYQVQNKDQTIKKKPPPPPPPVKRLDLEGSSVSSRAQPPPIPKATKPKF